MISNDDIKSNFLEEQVYTDLGYGKRVLFDKNQHPFFDNNKEYLKNKNYLQIKRETYALLKFLNIADKNGLKINTSYETRSKIHNYLNPDKITFWPKKSFFEIISLAQHYNLPTCALDWTYDYHAALYFAVKNILVDNNTECYENNDGVLWAFNYRYFQGNFEIDDDSFRLKFYRPEYYTNPNLSAQKGLFTFHIDSKWNCDERSVDELIIDELENHKSEEDGEHVYNIPGLMSFTIPKNEKIFYKFIIPEDIKADVLNQLYLEGYSEKSLFPGYKGVTRNIKNKAILDAILGRY